MFLEVEQESQKSHFIPVNVVVGLPRHRDVCVLISFHKAFYFPHVAAYSGFR